jgi:DNA-binding transcriptional LysR family regulator
MAIRDPGWELFRTFLEVARTQSLSAASRRLGLTQPTVGRQIDALEEALGVDLFTRSPRGLLPTKAARDLVPHAEAMAVAGNALLRAASGEATAETGTVRVTASEMIGCQVLPKILAEFRTLHRSIDLELVVSNRTEDLLRNEADIAVRMLRPTQSQLVTRKIGKVGISFYAHESYVATYGIPASLDELAGHCVIGFDRDDRSFRSVGSKSFDVTRETFGFRCDSDLAQLAAVRAGVGIGGCQDNIAKRDPHLRPVLRDAVHFELEMWLAMHEDLRATRRIMLLFEHLAVGLTRYVRGASDS